jgi:transposase-like protein
MLTSEREYKRNLEEIEMMNSLGKTGKVRRVVSTEFKELVELAIDIRYTLDEIINKLGVDPSKI